MLGPGLLNYDFFFFFLVSEEIKATFHGTQEKKIK
jgi:hypothetical protein